MLCISRKTSGLTVRFYYSQTGRCYKDWMDALIDEDNNSSNANWIKVTSSGIRKQL